MPLRICRTTGGQYVTTDSVECKINVRNCGKVANVILGEIND